MHSSMIFGYFQDKGLKRQLWSTKFSNHAWKNDSVKYHWFRPDLKYDIIEVKKICRKKQKEDILTKGVKKNVPLSMRKLLCGFWIFYFLTFYISY